MAASSEKDTVYEYALVIWWLLTVILAAFVLVYVSAAKDYYIGFAWGAGVAAASFIGRAAVNLATGGKFTERRYL